ncbi:MAG: Ig-like domain-containing protein [Myxococcota bacterium]
MIDEPPSFEAFNVNGSTSPPEVSQGGQVRLEAEVVDDFGVASVEFFDGDMSLGTDAEAPYELDVTVSSGDSGSHAYRAIATDTADQAAESESVTLSVNIIGGEIEFLREDLFRGADVVGLANGGIDVSEVDRVFLAALDVSNAVQGSIAIAFNDDLSQLWTRSLPFATPGRPITVDGELLVGGIDPDALTIEYRTLSTADGTIESELVFDTDAASSFDIVPHGLAARLGGNIAFHTSRTNFTAYTTDLQQQQWQTTLSGFASLTEADEYLFASLGDTGDDCAPGSSFCVRRIDSMGQTNWTAGLGTGRAAEVAPMPDGGAWAVVGLSEPDYQIFMISPEGEVTLVAEVESDPPHLAAVGADGSGGFVLAGAEGPYGSGRAFVRRYDSEASLVWDQPQFFNNNVDSAALDVQVKTGAVYVYGLSNNSTDVFSFEGDAWIARLSL